MNVNPNPECKDECRFQSNGSMTTLLYYHPVYDKHGNNLNPDGNTTTTNLTCTTCKKSWVVRTRYGKSEVEEV